LSTSKPLQRANILLSIGCESSRNLTAVVRLRCALNAVALRRDQMGSCAVVAREIAFDQGVAWHIRCAAGAYLSEWSEVMREDARDLLRRLRDCGAR
jgi:hypothetical protein